MSFQAVPPPGNGDPPRTVSISWSCARKFEARPNLVTIELVGLNQTLAQLGLPIDRLFMLELVLAEVLNNVVEHAYEDLGQGVVELSVEVRDNCILCSVTDQGAPMPGGILPPARRHNPNELATDDLPEGSFGWALIRDMTKDLKYLRDDGSNRLSFRIDLRG